MLDKNHFPVFEATEVTEAHVKDFIGSDMKPFDGGMHRHDLVDDRSNERK